MWPVEYACGEGIEEQEEERAAARVEAVVQSPSKARDGEVIVEVFAFGQGNGNAGLEGEDEEECGEFTW